MKYSLVSDINNKVTAQIKKLGLEIEGPNFFKINPSHHTIVIPCRLKSKKVIFRALVLKDKTFFENFEKELVFYSFLKQKKTTIPFLAPLSLDSGENHDFKWMVREYIEGKVFYKNEGFAKDFFNDKNLKGLIHSIKFLQGLTKEFLAFKKKDCAVIKIHERDYYWYDKGFGETFYREFKGHFIAQLKHYLSDAYVKQFQLLFSNNKGILNEYCQYLNHGDFHPNNILIKGKKFLIIDWEELHINNPMYDAALVWMYAWRDHKWRNRFIEEFLATFPEQDRANCLRIFKLLVLFFSAKWTIYFGDKIKKGNRKRDLKLHFERNHKKLKDGINFIS